MLANRVMITDKFKDMKSIFIRAACDCGDPDCDVTITVDPNEKYSDINLTFYKKVHSFDPNGTPENIKDRIENLISRFKRAFEIIFTGQLGMEDTFLLYGDDQITDFINAIEYARKYVKG
jgi:hypothetical protein